MDWHRYAPYITPIELACRCGRCPGSAEPPMRAAFLDALLAARLQSAVPWPFSCGYRCPAHNRAVGSDDGSAHPMGLAVDVVPSDSSDRGEILVAVLAAPLERRIRVGIGLDGHLHLDQHPGRFWGEVFIDRR